MTQAFCQMSDLLKGQCNVGAIKFLQIIMSYTDYAYATI